MEGATRGVNDGRSPCVARKMSEETQLPAPWRDWCASLERLHAALATVCVLFTGREAPTTLRSLRAAVERMAQLPLDATTLRLLQRVHGADEIGLDALGDDDIAVKLRLEKPGGAKRKRPDADASTSQQRRQRAPFAAARKIKDVPGLLAALTAAFRASVARFAAEHSKSDAPPPPLRAASPAPPAAASAAATAVRTASARCAA